MCWTSALPLLRHPKKEKSWPDKEREQQSAQVSIVQWISPACVCVCRSQAVSDVSGFIKVK